MAELTANWPELLYPGLAGIWGDPSEYKRWAAEHGELVYVKKSKQALERTMGMTGFGLPATTTEGEGTHYDDAFQGFAHNVTHVYFTLGFVVSSIMYEDDLYNKINALPKALRISFMELKEILAANLYNRWSTTGYTGADGVVLGSLLHPLRKAGGYLANVLSPAADLSMTSCEAIGLLVANFVDDAGIKIHAKVTKLWCAEWNNWTAQTILKTGHNPENPNRAYNPAQNSTKLVVSHYLTDVENWGVLTDVQETGRGLIYYERRAPVFTKDHDHDTDNAKFKGTMRASQSWDDPRAIAFGGV